MEQVILMTEGSFQNLGTVIPDDRQDLPFNCPGKLCVIYIQVKFNAGMSTDVVEIVGADRHPAFIANGKLGMQDVALVFKNLDSVFEQPQVHVTFCCLGNRDIRNSGKHQFDPDSPLETTDQDSPEFLSG